MCETNRVVVVPTTPKSEEFVIVVADMNKVNQTVHAEFRATIKQLREHCSTLRKITLPLDARSLSLD